MTDIGTFTGPKNKMVPCYHWNHDRLTLKFKKNDSLALIVEILYLKQNFFETDRCLSALTSSTSQMQSCFKIDLGLVKLFNV